jgi:tetratricopeptide (TPR) repeat protein
MLPYTVRPACTEYWSERAGVNKMLKKQTVKSLIVLSSSVDKVNAQIRQLTIEARQASFERDYKKVGLAAMGLVKVSPQSEPLARYFQALALNQQGKGNKENAIEIFKELTNTNLSYVKSAAFLALGVESYRIGDNKEALSFIKKSIDYNSNAPLTSVWCETYGWQGLSCLCQYGAKQFRL